MREHTTGMGPNLRLRDGSAACDREDFYEKD